nr:MAG: hypothetical protein [Marsupenaeus japonicus endogenous nimavirus]
MYLLETARGLLYHLFKIPTSIVYYFIGKDGRNKEKPYYILTTTMNNNNNNNNNNNTASSSSSSSSSSSWSPSFTDTESEAENINENIITMDHLKPIHDNKSNKNYLIKKKSVSNHPSLYTTLLHEKGNYNPAYSTDSEKDVGFVNILGSGNINISSTYIRNNSKKGRNNSDNKLFDNRHEYNTRISSIDNSNKECEQYRNNGPVTRSITRLKMNNRHVPL